MARDDDFTPFHDDPVYQALTGPGTPAELAGEGAALAAFRSAAAVPTRRRLVARLGTSGTVMVTAIGLSGGVAAAYTASLPQPVQRTLHQVLAPIGVPAPKPPQHHVAAPVTPSTSTPAPAAPVPNPMTASPAPSTPTTSADDSAQPAPPTPEATTTPPLDVLVTPGSATPAPPTSSPAPSTNPSPVVSHPPSPVVVGSLTITTSAAQVPVNGSVEVNGRVADADGTPLGGRHVVLYQRVLGSHQRQPIDAAVTSDAGTVQFTVSPVAHAVRLSLATAHGVRSAAVRVAVAPTLSVAVVTPPAHATSTAVTVSAMGAEPGDTVMLLRHRDGVRGRVATAQLDENGSATVRVRVSPRRPLHYRVVLSQTPAHAQATATFVTPAAAPPS